MTNFLDLYVKFKRLPFGNFLFNRGIGFVAPFFGKIRPQVKHLEAGCGRVEMRDRRAVRNHLGTVNAGALCTLAELTAGMTVDATIPAHLRWIPRAMTVQYLAKARGTLLAQCEIRNMAIAEGSIEVPVCVTDPAGLEVFTANITFHISKKKA